MGTDRSTDGSTGSTADGLRFESFPAGYDAADPAKADEQTARWFDAVNLGFHEDRTKEERLPAQVDGYLRDGRVLTAVYDDRLPEYAWDPAVPVATYATMVNDLNVGGSALLPAHLVTAVTVRPTHRRRGILRRMITADLARAKDSGLALAALTASEATIYGRFGFGAATSTAGVELETRGNLEFTSPPRGSIAIADADKLRGLVPDIFRAHLERTFGALAGSMRTPCVLPGSGTGKTRTRIWPYAVFSGTTQTASRTATRPTSPWAGSTSRTQ
ncbi:GNAT family N-acetyltransferase [Arthrobacter zhaoxinii]|uniref:GNAT family N-acetyltransferase n=1 Tax=Arthrobacter zhaoxinii TaxID=2964616 RepID=UPI0021032554|nr:GNAT family N-acetyltransferase [Arthrobacter zhaoxinii]MCQ2000875.1 GNAT family N-acetyltransferase [Arthrobacter zhaoxinii]